MEESEEEMEEEKTYTFGWIPDYPNLRDYTEEHGEIKPMLEKTSVGATAESARLSPSADLCRWFSPIENQKRLGSCTANAGVGIVEYYERRAFGKHIDASRLFLYKTTRNLMHLMGDTGASISATMGAMVLFGVPPEEYWPYTDRKPTGRAIPTTIPIYHFDLEPPAFCYSFAQNYQTIRYFNLDHSRILRDQLLSRIKLYIASGLPPMFGFAVHESIGYATRTGEIPYPCPKERVVGGHAIVACGYDDNKKITNPNCGKVTTGALRIRNSWGRGWGDRGYGWLPYEYVLNWLAIDFWVIVRKEWVDTDKFKI